MYLHERKAKHPTMHKKENIFFNCSFGIAIVLACIYSSYKSEANDLSHNCDILDNPNYQYIKRFSEIFSKLDDQMAAIVKDNRKAMNTVIFIGLTGAGKSTLVQLLSGDNEKLVSKEVVLDLGQFVITGSDKIGNDTITSQTLYPDLIIDNETGFVLCDSPGFEDTRSSIHELIAAASIVRIIKQSQSIKIVLVVPHSSIKTGMYRDNFIRILMHTIELIKDVDKYKNSIYLVATKTENEYKINKGVIKKVSEESTIDGIYHFLQETKRSIDKIIANNHTGTIQSANNLMESMKLIDALLANCNDTRRVNIFRRPEEEGPLSKIQNIQEERAVLREALLSNENFIETNNTDFGYTLSDSAKIDINKVFSQTNDYTFALSDFISHNLLVYYEKVLLKFDIHNKLKELQEIKSDITQLSDEIKTSKNPRRFIKTIDEFTLKRNMNYTCSGQFKRIKTINDYLINLEKYSNTTKYDPDRWQMPFRDLLNSINNNIENCNLVIEAFDILTSYNIQKDRINYYTPLVEQWQNNNENKTAKEKYFYNVIEQFLSENRYVNVKPNSESINILDEAIQLTIKSRLKIHCEIDTLYVVGYIILFSEIQNNNLYSCSFSKLVILAKHTVYIDKDLDNDMLKSKDIILIAPSWKIQGTRMISVNGRSGRTGGLHIKAHFGTVGRNGQNGDNAGNFVGIGMNFVNSNNLYITANGGDGEDGQDGGDGLDGWDGRDGGSGGYQSDDKDIYIVYNQIRSTIIYRGTYGARGGDSGAGGKGGNGGNRGTITVTNVGQKSNGIVIQASDGTHGKNGEDGKPGKGGYGGCDVEHVTTKNYILFVPVGGRQNRHIINCRPRSSSGSVNRIRFRNDYEDSDFFPKSYRNQINKCTYLSKFINLYENMYYSKLYDAQFDKFVQKTDNMQC